MFDWAGFRWGSMGAVSGVAAWGGRLSGATLTFDLVSVIHYNVLKVRQAQQGKANLDLLYATLQLAPTLAVDGPLPPLLNGLEGVTVSFAKLVQVEPASQSKPAKSAII